MKYTHTSWKNRRYYPFKFMPNRYFLLDLWCVERTECGGISPDDLVRVDAKKANEWIPENRLPPTSLRTALMYLLDITTPPDQMFLEILASFTEGKYFHTSFRFETHYIVDNFPREHPLWLARAEILERIFGLKRCLPPAISWLIIYVHNPNGIQNFANTNKMRKFLHG